MIDLDALEAGIAEGEARNFFVAPIVKELIAELREARGERSAVVAWLREEYDTHSTQDAADHIERGEEVYWEGRPKPPKETP